MKRLTKIVVAILVIAVVLFIARNVIVKAAFQGAVKLITGLQLDIESIRIGAFKSVIDVQGLRLLNPPGFVDKVMLDIPKIYLHYDISSFLRGKIHISALVLAFNEFVVVKNAEGQVNVNTLTALETQGKPQKEKKGKMPELNIDLMQLKIGKVVYKDYFNRAVPAVTEFRININEEYRNIDNPVALVSLITFKALSHTTVASLANLDLGPLKLAATESLKGATKLVSDTASKVVDLGEKAGKAAIGTVQNATQKLKSFLSTDK
ncbi:MAG: hypothetical protein AB1530_04945 [Candidatus Omnitrophota bacterium]